VRSSRKVHPLSWSIGILVAVAVLIVSGQFGLLAYSYRRFFATSDSGLLGNLELIAFTCSTMFVVEAIVRRSRITWQFGLRDLLVAMTATAIFLSLVVTEWRSAQQAIQAEAERRAADNSVFLWDADPLENLSLTTAPWVLRLPLLIGLGCFTWLLASAVILGGEKGFALLKRGWRAIKTE
jgi:hypothetical protein